MSSDFSTLSLGYELQLLTDLYLMGQVEGGDAQGPEAAQHWKHTEAQVVSRGHQQEVVLTLWVTWVLTLQKVHKDTGNAKQIRQLIKGRLFHFIWILYTLCTLCTLFKPKKH